MPFEVEEWQDCYGWYDELVTVNRRGPLWHRLPKGEQLRVLDSGITIGTFIRAYRQPKWCGYPIALGGVMGCWSLMTVGRVRRVSDCGDCDQILASAGSQGTDAP